MRRPGTKQTMRIASALSTGQFRRGPLLLFGTLVVGAFAAYEMAQYVINDDMNGLAYAGLCLAGGAIVIAILNNWRNGVYFFLAWLLFEDFARKFLGNNMAIYFAKDFFALVVYSSFLAAFRRKEVPFFRPPFIVPLLTFVWLGLMQVFNPASTSIWYGLMGFKMFFYYVPMIIVGYALLNSEAELRRFFRVNLVLILVIVSLGIAQSIIGPGFLNPAVQAEDIRLLSGLYRVSESGSSAYRPTSIFVSAGRYADFIMVAWILVLGFSGYLLLRQKRGRLLSFMALPVTAAGAFMTASRGSFMWAMIKALGPGQHYLGRAMAARGSATGVPLYPATCDRYALGIVLIFYTYPDALLTRLAIYEETLSPYSPTNELTHRGWVYPVQNFLGPSTMSAGFTATASARRRSAGNMWHEFSM